MANNFNTADFLKGAYFSPIQVGEHDVVLGRVQTVIETKENGDDASYLLIPITFSNNRTVDVRFYGLGAKIACDQLRQQLNDLADYNTLADFLKTLKGKAVKCYVSKRTYLKGDALKTTLQYDFLKPEVESAEETNDETDPF